MGKHRHSKVGSRQFLVFKPLSYYFEEAIGFDVKASLARHPVSSIFKPGDITKEC